MITASIGTNGILTLTPEADGISEYALWQWYGGDRLIRISGQGVMKCSPMTGVIEPEAVEKPVTEEAPQTTTETPPQEAPTDREGLKKALDDLGVEYVPKARDKTLQKLYDDATASSEDIVTEDPSADEEFDIEEEEDLYERKVRKNQTDSSRSKRIKQ